MGRVPFMSKMGSYRVGSGKCGVPFITMPRPRKITVVLTVLSKDIPRQERAAALHERSSLWTRMLLEGPEGQSLIDLRFALANLKHEVFDLPEGTSLFC